MKKHFLFLPFLLVTLVVSAEPIVRIVSTNAPDEAFATDQVRKLILTSTEVEVVNNEGSVLLSVPVSDIARVEFAEGTPTAIEATIQRDDEAVKIIEHGQVYILRSGKKYTIMGIEVENKE